MIQLLNLEPSPETLDRVFAYARKNTEPVIRGIFVGLAIGAMAVEAHKLAKRVLSGAR